MILAFALAAVVTYFAIIGVGVVLGAIALLLFSLYLCLVYNPYFAGVLVLWFVAYLYWRTPPKSQRRIDQERKEPKF